MATLNPLVIATQGKGVLGMLRRGEVIRQRYGLTPKRMQAQLSHFVSVLQEFACGATFPITTMTLARNRTVVATYQAQQIEFAAHGYFHKDQTKLSFAEKLKQFQAARQVFEECGIHCNGFRSPYLRTDSETLAALKQAGFDYDSSQALEWEVPGELQTPEYRRVLKFYGAVSAEVYPALPRWVNDLVHIPYCVPDDEAFVDRFHASVERMTELWLSVLKRTYARGQVFTVALHPERISLCEQALVRVLQEARRLPSRIWMTQLYRISDWWKARSQSEIRSTQEANGEMSVTASGPPGLTLLARGVQVTSPAGRWDESYLRAEGSHVRFRATRRPFIGVSAHSPTYLTEFLRQQGFIVEPAENGSSHSFYVDRSHFAYEDEQPLLDEIEQSEFPLVRLGRWPEGARSALCVTGDIDALTLWDYALRLF